MMQTIETEAGEIFLHDDCTFICMLNETHYIVYEEPFRRYFIETYKTREFLFNR